MLDESGTSTDWKAYDAWNEAIAAHFFDGSFAQRPVYLDMDQGTLTELAAMAGADCLVLLSDVDGLYTGDPHSDDGAELLEEIVEITESIEAMAGTTKSDYGRGGMITKIKAARIAVQAGCNMVITSGRNNHPLTELAGNGRRTVFLASANPATARKRWIAGSLKPR